jgi:hypothetical protein
MTGFAFFVPFGVIPGLVPGIHPSIRASEKMDCQDKPGNDNCIFGTRGA